MHLDTVRRETIYGVSLDVSSCFSLQGPNSKPFTTRLDNLPNRIVDHELSVISKLPNHPVALGSQSQRDCIQLTWAHLIV